MPHTKTLTNEEKHQLISDWKLPDTDAGERLYSCDAVIDAFVHGKNEGLEQGQKVLKRHFETNLKKSATATSVVLKLMNENHVLPISAFLQPVSVEQFNVMILVNEDDFIKDAMAQVYNQSYAIEQAQSEELFNISFNFINKSEGFTESLLRSDGYLFKYSK